ncbi:MAG: lipid-A-disaccharide synthase [Betaproteobacteria bacterium]|nr:lipid-A-disaccharide synthase [Betaproteobacteria bacterium]
MSAAISKIAMVAGESSGDLLASILMPGLKRTWPNVSLVGIGGPAMAKGGMDSWWPMEKLSVRGYVEVIKHYKEIVGIRKALKTRLLASPPDVFIGVDAPDFNLDLAFDLRAKGIPTVQYVCPSIWAWRFERIKKIRVSVDHVLCIFPFEKALLEKHGVDATFVGHPLANFIPPVPDKVGAREHLGLSVSDLVVAVLPGSRRDEIHQMTPRFLAAVEILQQSQPYLIPVLPVAPGMMGLVSAYVAHFPNVKHLKIIDGQSHHVMASADVAMVTSGTATLETALFKCPMVIAYAMPWLTWYITQRKRLQPWVGLPNILCADFVVPELIQAQATPKAIANSVLDWLCDPTRVTELKATFSQLHESLRADTASIAAHAIEKILAR